MVAVEQFLNAGERYRLESQTENEPEMLSLGLGLKALASASALASNIWPRPGLGLQRKNQQRRKDQRTNLFVLYFADYRTSDITLCWKIVTVRKRE